MRAAVSTLLYATNQILIDIHAGSRVSNDFAFRERTSVSGIRWTPHHSIFAPAPDGQRAFRSQ